MDKKKVAVPLVCHGHSRPVVDLFYSPVTPDGFFLISASKDSSPMLRNGETGDWIGTFEGHKGAVWSCCLDTNALRAASGSADFSAKLWDALTGDELQSFEHKHIVRACAFSEDTHLLLTGGFEKILRIFDLNRPDAPPREVDNSPGSIRTVAWLHSDQTILSSCADIGGVRLWDIRSGKIVQTLETKSPVTSAEVSQDGRYITTADGSTVKFWDANHFGLVKSYDMPCNVESASLEPKFGNKFVAGGEDMWIHVFDFHTGEQIGLLPNGDFEYGPKPSEMKGTVVTAKNAIPNWEISGFIEYIKSGHKQEVYAGKDRTQVPYESKGKGGFKRAKFVFKAVSNHTRITFLSSFYTMKSDNSGSLCGPVLDDVKLVSVRNPRRHL
ncbi:hypothetical protein D5086_001564 [Populus alba]|uniref:Uncharacterized protein n=1 Tax=Populus alba TaxID=43335 RepID=A0ACC4CZM7_POPAL